MPLNTQIVTERVYPVSTIIQVIPPSTVIVDSAFSSSTGQQSNGPESAEYFKTYLTLNADSSHRSQQNYLVPKIRYILNYLDKLLRQTSIKANLVL